MNVGHCCPQESQNTWHGFALGGGESRGRGEGVVKESAFSGFLGSYLEHDVEDITKTELLVSLWLVHACWKQ
jgi:hypothetical protein